MTRIERLVAAVERAWRRAMYGDFAGVKKKRKTDSITLVCERRVRLELKTGNHFPTDPREALNSAATTEPGPRSPAPAASPSRGC